MRNVIAFQKKMVVTPNTGVDNRNLAMMVQAELMQFGYMLNQEALDQLGHADAADIKDFHNEVIDYLKEMTGGKRDYRPVYSGFPQQVMEMSECELWINQLIGYWTGGTFNANEWTKTKGTAFEHVKYKEILPGTEEDFKHIFTSLVKSGTSLTPADMRIIKWFVNNYLFLEFPEVIPFKENLCTILGLLSEIGRGFEGVKLPKLTTTDVLRVVVYLSGGDISLPALPPRKVKLGRYRSSYIDNPEREKFKFKKFSRKERKFILDLLEHSNLDLRDMVLKDQRWIRLGEILHPGEYKSTFPRTASAFERLRNEKVVSWYGQVQKAFDVSFVQGLQKLSERPGEFLRRLDYLVRTYNVPTNIQQILNVFSKIGINSSNKVLFEVYDHFEKRRDFVTNRKIMIKGARRHTELPDLPAISKEIVDLIQSKIFDILKEKFSILPELGDCYIDEELKKVPLPTNMRSLNDSLVPIIRGTRIPFGTGKKVIRPFIHWFDDYGSKDIDLHGFLIGPGGSTSFGYNGIHSSTLGCYSGDVRYRQGACAEYVDIVVDQALAAGFKYFIMIAHNFNGDKLADIKECVAGVMEREFPESNKTWLPSTIQNSMLLKSGGNIALVAAYDLVSREYIHLDIDVDEDYRFVSGSLGKDFMNEIDLYLVPPKLSVYDLLKWHVEARGRIVSKETATTHFLFEDFSSSYVKTIEFMGV